METTELIKEKLRCQIKMFQLRHPISDDEMAKILAELSKDIKPKRVYQKRVKE